LRCFLLNGQLTDTQRIACRLSVALDARCLLDAGISLKVTYYFRNLYTKTIVLAMSRMVLVELNSPSITASLIFPPPSCAVVAQTERG
jgi:hypothetical protein